jgi:hypothetical protein
MPTKKSAAAPKKAAPKVAAAPKKAATPKRPRRISEDRKVRIPGEPGYFEGDPFDREDGAKAMMAEIIPIMAPLLEGTKHTADARHAMYALLSAVHEESEYPEIARKAYAMADAMAQVRKEREG